MPLLVWIHQESQWKINKPVGCKLRVKTLPLAYSVIQIFSQRQKIVRVDDLCAASHTLFYNTINKSGVMNLLVTSSSFSSLGLLKPTARQHRLCDFTLIRQWSLWQDQYIWEIHRGTGDWMLVPILKTPRLEWWLMGNWFDRGQCHCVVW